MVEINLTNLEKSSIKYKISKFPDGQQDIVFTDTEGSFLISGRYNNKIQEATIKSRFNSFKDLELIIAANKALRRLGVKEIHLDIPYLLGARSDRQFQEGGNSYLVDVIAPILNAQEFESITVLDVHSDVAAACIKNLKVITNEKLVRTSIINICENPDIKKIVVISPDAGAQKKIYKSIDGLAIVKEVVTASKKRDVITGNITETVVPLVDKYSVANYLNTDFVIIDDICDGGRTFIEIAKKIKEKLPYNKIHLVVTHGIFSAGLDTLSTCFNNIYTTNSVLDLDAAHKQIFRVKQLTVI